MNIQCAKRTVSVAKLVIERTKAKNCAFLYVYLTPTAKDGVGMSTIFCTFAHKLTDDEEVVHSYIPILHVLDLRICPEQAQHVEGLDQTTVANHIECQL